MLPVIETFTSIQGESTHAGRICFFIRLAGCNLRCSYCDTAYAWQGGRQMSVDELMELAVNSGVRLVEITGGEPLIHPETPELAGALINAGLEVLVETNGSMDIALLPKECRRIVDCKLPSSGMAERILHANWAELTPQDEVKFVIGNRIDFDFAVQVIKDHNIAAKSKNILFSPIWGAVDFQDLAAWVISAKIPSARMQLQLHKIIWGDKTGV